MATSRATARGTLAKYVALQVPGFLLVVAGLAFCVWSFELPLLLAAGILVLWITKDALMYPIVRVAYEPVDHDPDHGLVGAVGTAKERIDPEGWVRIGSELWRARLVANVGSVDDGDLVRVVSVKGLTLTVEPA